MSDRPLILITNDDGVSARGINALRNAVMRIGHVVVVAPTREQSASSHSITIDRPLRHIEHAPDVHSIDGTPADCVYLALFEKRFLPRRPDLVLSGINHGWNLGTSVFYSGTVAGAREAAMRNIPAIAFSAPTDADFEQCAAQSALISERLLRAERADTNVVLFSVNYPKQTSLGLRVARVGTQIYEEHVIARRDPGGREYFWIGGQVTDNGDRAGTDTEAVAQGYTAITPLSLEATGHDQLRLASQLTSESISDDR